MKKEAKIFKALSDETRLRLLALLLEGELCVCDLMAVLDLPQSTVSRHLAYLRNAGLVNDRRKGVWMFYSLSDAESPLQREMVRVLREHLPDCSQALNDRDRLLELGGRSALQNC